MKFEQMESLLGIDMYGAIEGKFSFVVGYIEDLGWTASYKDREYEGSQSSHYIKDSLKNPFKTRQQAEAACRYKLKELKKH